MILYQNSVHGEFHGNVHRGKHCTHIIFNTNGAKISWIDYNFLVDSHNANLVNRFSNPLYTGHGVSNKKLESLNMDIIPEKVWALVAAIISALGGFVLYERKRVDTRLSRIEQDLSQHKTDLAVVKESLANLKEDTQEIKEILLSRKRK